MKEAYKNAKVILEEIYCIYQDGHENQSIDSFDLYVCHIKNNHYGMALEIKP